jgi:hypothetical protein
MLAGFAMPLAAQDCAPGCDCSETKPKLLLVSGLPLEIDQAALQLQYDALSGMDLARIEYSPLGPVESLEGWTGWVVPPDLGERDECEPADDLLAVIGALLLATGTESLLVGREKAALSNRRSRMFVQSIRGIPVIHGLVGVEYDVSTLAVTRLVANFLPDRGLPESPKLTAQQAERALPDGWTPGPHLDPESVDVPQGTHLSYFSPVRTHQPLLVWAIPVSVGGMPEWAYVNAVTGRVEGHVPSHVHDATAVVSRPCGLRR